jgi:hypothetical protein
MRFGAIPSSMVKMTWRRRLPMLRRLQAGKIRKFGG